jgi:hypothetical protein
MGNREWGVVWFYAPNLSPFFLSTDYTDYSDCFASAWHWKLVIGYWTFRFPGLGPFSPFVLSSPLQKFFRDESNDFLLGGFAIPDNGNWIAECEMDRDPG